MKLKVCGITNAINLQALHRLDMDYFGFIFYPKSKRFVSDKSILSKLEDKSKAVGVFVNEQLDILLAITQNNAISTVQLHGDESPDYCFELQQCGLSVIKAFNLHKEFDYQSISPYHNVVDYYLFDAKGSERGGNGVKFNWDLLGNYQLNTPFFLSGGITEFDVEKIKNVNHPLLYVIDINSGFELSPGIKNVVGIERFKNQLSK